MTITVLVVDDDRTARETMAAFCDTLGYVARTAPSVSEGRQVAAVHAPDIVLLDLRLLGDSGHAVLDVLHADDPELGIVMLTGRADVCSAVRTVQHGALDYLEKPVDLETLAVVVTRAAECVQLRRELSLLRRHHGAAALSKERAATMTPSLERLIDLAAHNDDVPVLIVGEAGTGKRDVARQIHEKSARALEPFLETLGASFDAISLESMLFGHERRAFIDSKPAKRGLLEVAGRGTVFLAEVSEVALEVQRKMLEVLERRTFRRMGSTVEMRTEVRILAGSAQPLADRARQGRFRADLYSSLEVLTISLPPLRERRHELPTLALALAPQDACFSANALHAIERYPWPGNFRELKNTLWRATLLAEGAPIAVSHLGLPTRVGSSTAFGPLTLAEAERRTIADALDATEGNKVHAARLLGIARSTLLEKLKKGSRE